MYACMFSRAHAQKHARTDETSIRRKRLPYFCKLSYVQPRSWSALQEQIQAERRARKASLRSKRQALNSLNHGNEPGEKLKYTKTKLILKGSHR